MTLYVGTSGWAYREWKPDFYPEDLKQADFLNFYATRLSACEINATFYRLQKEDTFSKWAESVPDEFRFALKTHRRLTHGRRIAPDGDQKEFLDTFKNSLRPLEGKLGTILFQFPPYRSRLDDQFEVLLDAIDGLTCAFEFRHDSWNKPEIAQRVAERGHTMCVADTTGQTPEALPAGPIAYSRLRHERYTEAQRDSWRDLLAKEAVERDVYVFAKHEGTPPDDPFGGVGLATWLCGADD